MFFLAFVFAYFYLRSLNNGGRWRPAGIDPPQAYGDVIVVLFVVSAGLVRVREPGRASGRAPGCRWRARRWRSALAGCVVQGFEWANLGFSPTEGGYASVFLGWTLLFTVFVLVAMYWVEIVFATGLRHRSGGEAYVLARPRRRLLLLDAAGGRRRRSPG